MDAIVSVSCDPEAAADDLGRALAEVPCGAVVVFASPRYDLGALVDGIAQRAGTAAVIGASTAGEFALGKAYSGAAVAMGIPRALCPAASAILLDDVTDRGRITAALERAAGGLGRRVRDLVVGQHAGIVVPTGRSESEELVMEVLGDATDVTIAGGSAGDDLRFERPRVAVPGAVSDATGALLLLDLPAGHRVIKTQSFRRTGIHFTPTRVEGRRVLEIDGQPAAKRYAELVGCAQDQVLDRFFTHPCGLMVDGEPFVRTCHILEGDTLVFFCRLLPGIPVELLVLDDVIDETRRALEADRLANGPPAALLGFDCVSRRVHLEKNGQLDAYAALYDGLPHAGFSTYGEQLYGHLNQTAVMLALGR